MKEFKYNGKGIPKIEIRGNQYKVHFQHNQEYIQDEKFSKRRVKGITIAYIIIPNAAGDVRIEAEALCSVKDTFSKQKGRIVAAGKLYSTLLYLEKNGQL